MNSGSLTLIYLRGFLLLHVGVHACVPVPLGAACELVCRGRGVGEGYPLRETINLPAVASWPGRGVWLNAYGIHVLCVVGVGWGCAH